MATDCLIFQVLAQASPPPTTGTKLDSGTWIALAIGAMATMFILYQSRKRQKTDPLEHRPLSASLAQQRSVERQMSSLLVELSEMARQLTAGLDTRTAKLEALMDEADRRIQKLESLERQSGAPVQPTARQMLLGDASPAEPEPPPPQFVPEVSGNFDERHGEVYAMANQGRNAQEIAATLGRPSGEIELILALRPRPADAAHARAG